MGAYLSKSAGVTFPGGDIASIDSPSNKIDINPVASTAKNEKEKAPIEKNGFDSLPEVKTIIPFLLLAAIFWIK